MTTEKCISQLNPRSCFCARCDVEKLETAKMDDDDHLVSFADIQKAVGGRSRSFVYDKVLPHLELVKVGKTVNTTKRSLRGYMASLPRLRSSDKSEAA